MTTGALTKIIGLTQSAFREVPVSPDGEVLYVRTFEYRDSQPLENDPTLAGGLRGPLRGVRGRVDASGNAVVSIGTSIGFWLKHLIGAPTTTGAGAPYTHSFAVGDGANAIPPALMTECDFTSAIATPGRFVRDQDIRIESAAFAFSTASPFQTATFSLRGASKTSLPVAALDSTPTDYGHAAFAIAGLTLELDDGATEVCVETLNLNWNNDLDTDLYCLNDGGLRHNMPEGQALITGEGVAQFDTPALLAKAIADEDLKVVISMVRGSGDGTANNESLVITIPVAVLEASAPPISGPRGLKQPFSFSAYRTAGNEVGVEMVLDSARAVI